MGLFKQVHITVSIQFPEKGIGQVIYKLDGLPCAFHFRPQAFIHVWKLIKREDRDLDRITIELFLKIKITEFVGTQHDFSRDIEVWDFICFGDKWSRS